MTHHTHQPATPVTDRHSIARVGADAEHYPLFSRCACGVLIRCADSTADWAVDDGAGRTLPPPTPRDGLAVIDRLLGQRANSTPRRDQFSLTRREVEALEALAETYQSAPD